MRAGIYGSIRIRSMSALALGLVSLGWSVTWREDRDAYKPEQEDPREFDLIVTEGIRGTMGQLLEKAKSCDVPVLVSDAGFVRRDLRYLQLSINGLNWIPEFEVPGDRWAALDVELKPQHSGTYILIAGQKPGDAAHKMSSFELRDLYQNWGQELAGRTERRVLFRPHPMGREVAPAGLETTQGGPLALDLAGAHALVTWNSTTATDALIAGTPAFVLGPNAQAEELANTALEFIDQPFFPSPEVRVAFFHRVAYAQWTLEEFQNGQALEFVLGAMARQGLERKTSV